MHAFCPAKGKDDAPKEEYTQRGLNREETREPKIDTPNDE